MTFLIALFSVLISVGGSIYIYKNKNHSDIARETLEHAYIPVLQVLQKHLFKDKEYYETASFIEARDKAEKLIIENSMIFPFYIREIFEDFLDTRNPVKKEKLFKNFSNQFLNSYNDLCKSCHLPGIPVSYRRKHGLYKSKISGILNEIWTWVQAIYMMLIILMFGIIIAFIVYKLLAFVIIQLNEVTPTIKH